MQKNKTPLPIDADMNRISVPRLTLEKSFDARDVSYHTNGVLFCRLITADADMNVKTFPALTTSLTIAADISISIILYAQNEKKSRRFFYDR